MNMGWADRRSHDAIRTPTARKRILIPDVFPRVPLVEGPAILFPLAPPLCPRERAGVRGSVMEEIPEACGFAGGFFILSLNPGK
jgi:hypothetical protein